MRRRTARPGSDLIGDDAALLPGDLAVTVDHQIEGVHFPPGLDPAKVARRLLAVNLSDLAAVGARPRHAFLALAAPREYDRKRLLRALIQACSRHGVELAGGDNAVADKVSLSLTLVGGRLPRGRWVERSGAEPGDRLWIGGPLGASALGRHLLELGAQATARGIDLPPEVATPTRLARTARAAVRIHLQPRPQLELGHWLARRRRAAAIDISDGLALDLHRLCRASGVGALIDPTSAPTLPHFRETCERLDLNPLDQILRGGEDYVLLFALPAAIDPPTRFECSEIGRLHADSAIRTRAATGTQPLDASGWDHLRPV